MNAATHFKQPIIRRLGEQDYALVYQEMCQFTDHRDAKTRDEIWLLQHRPVFTLGRNANKSNLLIESNIPVIQSDRGGDVTYHGPGQLVIYCLMDLKRLHLGVKNLVIGLEQVVIQYLSEHNIEGQRLKSAPGVYVNENKLASLGLRVRQGCSFHGLAVNVKMDKTPFTYINPCGIEGMKVTQLADLGISESIDQVASRLMNLMAKQFYG